MNTIDEINEFAEEDNKPILRWLFEHYHWSNQWHFVASCVKQRYGSFSYQTNRIWQPTQEGLVLYHHRDELIFE